MAIDTKKAIKISQKHLLGIQDLKISEIKYILNEAQQFIELNRRIIIKKITTNWIKDVENII